MAESFALDSSCIVAALSDWHSAHAATVSAAASRISGGQRMIAAAHSLAEAYAVLTRMPEHSLPPERVLEITLEPFPEPAVLSVAGYVDALRSAAAHGLVGGAVYDHLIACAVRRAGATEFLTLNPQHFARYEAPDFRVVVPGEAE